jgi:2-dehydro-3-deoxyphosphogluconate aldolase/(4S)-4-hydroxy-2-oxoglutarate aldolase
MSGLVDMKLGDVKEAIAALKIVPVVKLDRPEDAEPLAGALIAGGLPVAEITFRTEAAAGAIAATTRKFPEMLVGAGTVTTTAQAAKALDFGAQFIVTPGFSRETTEFCLDRKVAIFPGVCTPSEIMWLMEYGLDVAKFFPAAQFGGLATIKALSGPFPSMRFMPTGGISEKNLAEYLAFEKVLACGGSWMVRDDLISAGRFDEIERLTAESVRLAG